MVNKDILLIEEYKAAQESAQHHDREAWQRFYWLTLLIIILAGYLLQNEFKNSLRLLIILIGCYLSIQLFFINEYYSNIILHKYSICKNIEEDWNMCGNHKGLEKSNWRFKCAIHFFVILLLVFWIGCLLYYIF